MPIREPSLEILKAWLPSDYPTATTWDDPTLQAALDAGHHPRAIAAEVWEEWALGKTDGETDGEQVVKSWQNVDISVEYDINDSPRSYGLKQARLHRLRAPVKSVRLANSAPVYEEE